MKNQKIMKVTVIVGIIAVILLGVTFALTSITTAGTKRQVITTGELDIILDEDDAINLTNAMPVYDEVGMIGDAFNFRLVNKTPVSLAYTLKLVKVSTSNELSPEIVRYGLTKDGETTIDFLSAIADDIVDSGTISGNQTIEYSLRLWIDINVEDESLINGKTLSYRVDAEASEVKDVGEPITTKAFASNNLGENCSTYNDGEDTFLVGNCQNNYVWYSGKLWRVVLKNNETSNVKMITDDVVSTIYFNYGTSDFENSYMDQWLQQEFLPTLHDIDDYLITNTLWDVSTLSTSDPTKPTQDKTLRRTVGLLNSYEYYTTYKQVENPSTYSGYLYNGMYWWLMNPISTTSVSAVNLYGSLSAGSVSTADSFNYAYGVRPSVVFKSDIGIISGEGTKNSPYRLDEKQQEVVNGSTFLNTRNSGEYLTFNNELYRIVRVENKLTKIIAVDVPEQLSSIVFHPSNLGSGCGDFDGADIKTTLTHYYRNLDDFTRSTIQPNTFWYYGSLTINSPGTTPNLMHYKRTICKSDVISADINTTDCEKTYAKSITDIGLPRIGEMFTSQITRAEKSEIWNITPLYYSAGLLLQKDGRFNSSGTITSARPVRPSTYLKSNVYIASDNEGDGTYEFPYKISYDDFSINNNRSFTLQSAVILNFYSERAVQMCVSNTKNCSHYEAFTPTKSWTLTSGDGEKKVYVYYKDSKGKIFAEIEHSIIVDSNAIIETFEDNVFDSKLTVSGSGTYPWTVQNGRFVSTNKGKTQSSVSTIQFTPNIDSKLNLDFGASGEDSLYTQLRVVLKSSNTSKSWTSIKHIQEGRIVDEPLKAGVTYTLELTYSKSSKSTSENEDTAYIDNLYIGP